MLTAVGQEKITEDAFNKGANYYIMKPFNHTFIGSDQIDPKKAGGF